MKQTEAYGSMLLEKLKQEPNEPEHFSSYGVYLAEQGKEEEAEDFFRRAIELSPHNSTYYHNLGVCLMNQKKFTEALVYQQSAVRLAPGFSIFEKGLEKCQMVQNKEGWQMKYESELYEELDLVPGDSIFF